MPTHRSVPPRPIRRATRLAAVAAVLSATMLVPGTSSALASRTTIVDSTVDSGASPGLRTRMANVVATGVPGVVVLIQAGGVRLAAAGAADLGTGTPLRPPARVRVGSLTKTFVATVALQLVGERRLGLDEPVARRLPGLLASGERITVRQLLNHTSGLPDYLADPGLLAGIAQNRVFTPTELVAIAENQPAPFPPGTGWAYSNTNYIVAGLLIEAVTHERLGQQLQRRVFGPLHLADTSFPVATAEFGGYHAHGYVPADLVPTPDGRPYDVTGLNPSAAWAAGAIISTVTDLAAFYRALLTGRLLNAALLREMKTTVAQDPADPNHFRYGLGLERVPDTCGVNWGHSGSILGYQDAAYWNERTGRTVVVASTMFPVPEPAQAVLSDLTDFALCGDSGSSR